MDIITGNKPVWAVEPFLRLLADAMLLFVRVFECTGLKKLLKTEEVSIV